MESKNVPEWKLKTCEVCEKEYPKGEEITKIWLIDEDKYEEYPNWRYIGFEGIGKFKQKSYAILCFCSEKCFNEFICKK